ncbi:MAG: hypothetical protein E7600_08540 [Ruminococcaceae bacterium]|nr:hypothetical protein [Oscillospiraceae bacterium]
MKKILSAILLIAAVLTVSVFAASPVAVTLNGEKIDCASYGQEATIVEGRTLVPLRAIFEALGASVEWEQSTKKVVSRLDTTIIDLTVGEKELHKFTLDSEGYIIDSQTVILDVPAQIMNDRTLVPVRAISESFGVNVEWDGESRTVILVTGTDALNEYNAYLDGILEPIEPKSDLDKEILLTVGGLPVSAASVRSYVMLVCDSGQDITDENVLKEIETLYKQDAALVKFAFNERITLDEADVNKIKADIFGLQIQMGDNYEKAFAESPYTKFYYYLNSSLYPIVYSKISDTYAGSDNEEIRKSVLEYFEENDYVRAKHILVQYPYNPTEEEREAAFSKALDVLKEVKAMKDVSEFDALIEKYNEDPGMTANPAGYYFTYGEMVKPFEEATYALEIGATSSLVETDYGFHIILRLPLDDENLTKTQEYANAVSNVLWETIVDIAEGLEVEYADNYNDRVNDFVKEYEELIASL